MYIYIYICMYIALKFISQFQPSNLKRSMTKFTPQTRRSLTRGDRTWRFGEPKADRWTAVSFTGDTIGIFLVRNIEPTL